MLNDTFLNNLGNWNDKLTIHSWSVGGFDYNSGLIRGSDVYDREINENSIKCDSKVALMYVSDYIYAASNNYWSISLSSYSNASTNNWLFLNAYEWTLSPVSISTSASFNIDFQGGIVSFVVNMRSSSIRPTFYLTSSTEYVSGSGTSIDPIRIN